MVDEDTVVFNTSYGGVDYREGTASSATTCACARPSAATKAASPPWPVHRAEAGVAPEERDEIVTWICVASLLSALLCGTTHPHRSRSSLAA